MRFEDERYIRLFTRDTITWRKIKWQGRTLLSMLFRVVDRAGILDVDSRDLEGLAELVLLPLEIVEVGLERLITTKTVEWVGERGDVLFIPNFLKAQEAAVSTHSASAINRSVPRPAIVTTPLACSHTTSTQPMNRSSCHVPSRTVTSSPATSQAVTLYRTVLSLPYPNQNRAVLELVANLRCCRWTTRPLSALRRSRRSV